MLVLSSVQMREVDRATIEECGIPGSALMEQAAAAVEARILRDFPAALAGRIAILCGGGNNGGDGLVLARRLALRQARLHTLLFAPAAKLRGDAAAALAAVPAPPEILDAAAWQAHRPAVLGCDLIVDALFGTGLVHPLAGWLRAVVEDLNHLYRGAVIAVDVPSGLCADAVGAAEKPDAAVLRASATVTFTAPKLGHYLSAHADAVGLLSVAPIGSPGAVVASAHGLRLTAAADCAPFLAPRPRDGHKGRFGHVLAVAGSLGKSGAAALVGTAALRIGAGLVTVATPRSSLPMVASALAELMTVPLPEDASGAWCPDAAPEAPLQDLLDFATVLALGPGLNILPATAAAVRQLATSPRLPCVLDADGLNAFAHRRHELRLPGGVLTPHPGEMARLFDVSVAEVQSRRLYYVERLAAESGAVALLKGSCTVIADPEGAVFLNPTGNPGMATAGAGDVLTGLIAGLVAQFPTFPRLHTVAAAVYLHGRAGDLAAAQHGEMSLIAGDLIAALPDALREARAA